MYDRLTGHIQSAAYLQWEVSGAGSALEHWRCVEDIVCFFEAAGILNEELFLASVRNEDGRIGYEDLVREIAFRLSFYSGKSTSEENWFLTEQLLHNSEWRQMVILSADIYAKKKNEPGFCGHIRSERVRDYYRRL